MNFDKVLQKGVEKNASDVHLVKGLKPFLRIDGELVESLEFTEVTDKFIQDFVFGVISDLQKEILQEKRGLDFGYQGSDNTRFRINMHYEKGGLGLVARIIPAVIPSLESLDMPDPLYEMTKLKAGLVLVTGPTGCGKSTTLAGMINSINKERKSKIITLEDPIEFVYKREKSIIEQRELGKDIPSFAEGLKQALRSDPDVILVGELRDLETISVAITVAETGHLVFGTLHTYSAAQTVDRIIDAFPPHQQNQIRLQLSMVLKSVVSQRLLPKIGGGRIGLHEILLNTPAVGNLIRENKTPQINNVIQTHSKMGMMTMDQSIKKAFKAGILDKDIALENAMDPAFITK